MRGMKDQTFLTPDIVPGKQEFGAGTYDAKYAVNLSNGPLIQQLH